MLKFLVLSLMLTAFLAPSACDLQSQQDEHLDPLNDADAASDSPKDQDKRTIFGPTIPNFAWARHVAVHPGGGKRLLGFGPVDLRYSPVVRPFAARPHLGYHYDRPRVHYHVKRPVQVLHSGWKPIVTRPVHVHQEHVDHHKVPHLDHVHLEHVHQTVPLQVLPRPVAFPGLFEVTKPDLGVLPLGAVFPSPVLKEVPAPQLQPVPVAVPPTVAHLHPIAQQPHFHPLAPATHLHQVPAHLHSVGAEAHVHQVAHEHHLHQVAPAFPVTHLHPVPALQASPHLHLAPQLHQIPAQAPHFHQVPHLHQSHVHQIPENVQHLHQVPHQHQVHLHQLPDNSPHLHQVHLHQQPDNSPHLHQVPAQAPHLHQVHLHQQPDSSPHLHQVPAHVPHSHQVPVPQPVAPQVALPPGVSVEYHGTTNFVNLLRGQAPRAPPQLPDHFHLNYPQIPQVQNRPQQPPDDVPRVPPGVFPDHNQPPLDSQVHFDDEAPRYQSAGEVSAQHFYRGSQAIEQLDHDGYSYPRPENFIQPGRTDVQVPAHLPAHPGFQSTQRREEGAEYGEGEDDEGPGERFRGPSYTEPIFKPSIQLEPPYRK